MRSAHRQIEDGRVSDHPAARQYAAAVTFRLGTIVSRLFCDEAQADPSLDSGWCRNMDAGTLVAVQHPCADEECPSDFSGVLRPLQPPRRALAGGPKSRV